MELSNTFVILMGLSVVFLGLICIIILCTIMSKLCNIGSGKKKAEMAAESAGAPAVIENKQEILAAVCAVAAEELSTDISAIRVLSFKKI